MRTLFTSIVLLFFLNISATGQDIQNSLYQYDTETEFKEQKETEITTPYALNGEKPFKYDFKDFTGAEDYRSNKATEYFPHYMTALFVKFNTLQAIGLKYIDKYGQTPSPFIEQNYKAYNDTRKQIENFGFREVNREDYEEWVRVMEKEKDNLLNETESMPKN